MSTFGDGTFEHPEHSLRDLGVAFEWSKGEIAALTAERDRLLSELADERAKKSDALIAAVDDIERLTAERDDATALAKNYAERMARSDANLTIELKKNDPHSLRR